MRFETIPNLMAVLSGILLTAAFPKIDLSALAWAAFVPLLWAVRNAGPGEAFRRGMVFGIAHHLSLLYWLVPTMTIYGHLPLPLAIGILFLFASVLSLVFTAPCIGALALAGPSPARLLVAFPVLWTASEFLRSFLFTGFPWGLLGYSQYRHLHLIQIADVLGVYGISALVALAGAALFLIVAALAGWNWQGQKISRRLAVGGGAAALALAAAAWGYGGVRIEQIDRLAAAAPKINTAVVQGNIEQSEKWDPAFQAAAIEKYLKLSLSTQAQAPDLIVWPESAAPFYFLAEGPPTRAVMQGVAAAGTNFLIGAPSFELKGQKADYFNSAYLVAPGEILGKYDKAHLVPFGEYTPFKEYLPFLGKIVEHVGDFKAGPEGHTLSLGGPQARHPDLLRGHFPGARARPGAQRGGAPDHDHQRCLVRADRRALSALHPRGHAGGGEPARPGARGQHRHQRLRRPGRPGARRDSAGGGGRGGTAAAPDGGGVDLLPLRRRVRLGLPRPRDTCGRTRLPGQALRDLRRRVLRLSYSRLACKL